MIDQKIKAPRLIVGSQLVESLELVQHLDIGKNYRGDSKVVI